MTTYNHNKKYLYEAIDIDNESMKKVAELAIQIIKETNEHKLKSENIKSIEEQITNLNNTETALLIFGIIDSIRLAIYNNQTRVRKKSPKNQISYQ